MRKIESDSADWYARFLGSPVLTIPAVNPAVPQEAVIDLYLAEDLYLDGGYVLTWGAAAGDKASFQVIDPGFIPEELRGPEWPVLDEWATDVLLPTVDGLPLEVRTDYRGFINAGLGLRLKVTTSGASEVKIGVNFFLHKKT